MEAVDGHVGDADELIEGDAIQLTQVFLVRRLKSGQQSRVPFYICRSLYRWFGILFPHLKPWLETSFETSNTRINM